MITFARGAPPAEQIQDQLRGLIASGQLAADERIPSVRQLARDLGVAPGTVAKAYRNLEAEGYLTARPGRGTRVSPTPNTVPLAVRDAARQLAQSSIEHGTELEDSIRILRALWPESRD